jgi:hypothetical protein
MRSDKPYFFKKRVFWYLKILKLIRKKYSYVNDKAVLLNIMTLLKLDPNLFFRYYFFLSLKAKNFSLNKERHTILDQYERPSCCFFVGNSDA